ncbi:MAG: hypothetical protein EA383_03070 [Spirochaetaceae bacterium]|nr:MAG: hypothetical protein EA383_03070 [Spirochaetaceae bacterium]
MEQQSPGDQKPRSRRRASFWTYPISNFYPGYGDSDGRLERIEPISAVSMQRILPRYDLSTSRTRTTGLGPALIETPVFFQNRVNTERRAAEDESEAYFEDDDTGQIFDIDA